MKEQPEKSSVAQENVTLLKEQSLKRVQDNSSIPERELTETCPLCGQSTIEEKLDFKGKLYAVSTCSKCNYFDWILPEGLTDSMSKEFEESQEWAEQESDEIKTRHNILLLPVHVAETVSEIVTMEIKQKIASIAKSLGYSYIYIGQYRHGLKIEMR